MPGKQAKSVQEIRADLEVCSKLRDFGNTDLKWWSYEIFYKTVSRWRKKNLTHTESVKDAAKPGWPVTVTSKANVSKASK